MTDAGDLFPAILPGANAAYCAGDLLEIDIGFWLYGDAVFQIHTIRFSSLTGDVASREYGFGCRRFGKFVSRPVELLPREMEEILRAGKRLQMTSVNMLIE